MKKYFAFFAIAVMAFASCKKDPAVATVSVDPATATIEVGGSTTLRAVIAPDGARDVKVTWTSSSDAIATVSASGVVTGVSAGTAIITATVGGKKGTSTVTVLATPSVTIAGDGFDIAEVQTIVESASMQSHVQVDVAASRGIDKFLVEITTSSEGFNFNLSEMGLAGEFDIANPGPLGTVLTMVGLANGAAVKGQTELGFDISTFIPMIFMAAAGQDLTAEFKVTVEDALGTKDSKTLKLNLVHDRLRNGGFEDWSSTVNSMTQATTSWFPYSAGADGKPDATTRFWDTANGGLNLAGTLEDRNPTLPSEDVRPGSNGTRSAYMNSCNVRVVIVNKFAAGNLFTGSFGKVEMLKGGATVYFGQPFSLRPSALKGWFKANAGTINYAGEGSPKELGEADEYQIYIALTTWDAPHQVDTWDPTTFMDFTGDDIVAYGELSGSEAVTDWEEFEITLDYRSQTATPTHIVIVATSSKYGDYFTGSDESWLQVDDFELVYE